jgi:hypothetical protein
MDSALSVTINAITVAALASNVSDKLVEYDNICDHVYNPLNDELLRLSETLYRIPPQIFRFRAELSMLFMADMGDTLNWTEKVLRRIDKLKFRASLLSRMQQEAAEAGLIAVNKRLEMLLIAAWLVHTLRDEKPDGRKSDELWDAQFQEIVDIFVSNMELDLNFKHDAQIADGARWLSWWSSNGPMAKLANGPTVDGTIYKDAERADHFKLTTAMKSHDPDTAALAHRLALLSAKAEAGKSKDIPMQVQNLLTRYATSIAAFRASEEQERTIKVSRTVRNLLPRYFAGSEYHKQLAKRRYDYLKMLKSKGLRNKQTTRSADQVASVIFDTSHFVDAEIVYRLVLEQEQRTVDADDPDIICSWHNISACLHESGQQQASVDMDRLTLEKSERVLGIDSLETLRTRNNLAVSLDNVGCSKEAEVLFRDVLKKRHEKLGWKHADTLITRGELAKCLFRQGLVDESDIMCLAVVEDAKKLKRTDPAREYMWWCLGEERWGGRLDLRLNKTDANQA